MSIKGYRNMTPLQYALDEAHRLKTHPQSDHIGMVKKIISRCTAADINALTAGGHTALMMAIRLPNAELVNRLIQQKADVAVMDPDGSTSLIKVLEMINRACLFMYCFPVVYLLMASLGCM